MVDISYTYNLSYSLLFSLIKILITLPASTKCPKSIQIYYNSKDVKSSL